MTQRHADEAIELELGRRVAWAQRNETLFPLATVAIRFRVACGPWKEVGS